MQRKATGQDNVLVDKVKYASETNKRKLVAINKTIGVIFNDSIISTFLAKNISDKYSEYDLCFKIILHNSQLSN